MSTSSSRRFGFAPGKNFFAHVPLWAAVVCIAIGWLTLPLSAAQPSQDNPAARKSADEAWAEVKDLGKPGFRAVEGKEKLTADQARQEVAKQLLREADRLQEFQTKHSDHAEAKEAKRLEALALLQAEQAGDTSRESRRKQLVQELRKDPAVPANKRSEVAAFSDNIGVGKRANLSSSAKLAAYEEVARNLIAEFPDLPDAYEALVQIAKDSPDNRAPIIAGDVTTMERAPTWVKKEAKAMVGRYGLVGKSLVEPTKIVIAKDNPFEKALGSPLVVYTWSTEHELSVARAKELPLRLPANVKLVGVCLDRRDLAPAKARAEAEKLPGEQIYDWLGRRGEIAEALGAVDPGLVYVVDASGILKSVSAQRDLAAALAQVPAQ